MSLPFRKLHAHFVAEAGPVDLRQVHDPETLARIRAGMDDHAVLVFHDQPFTDDEHLEFARRLDGLLHTKPGSSALVKNRFGNEALGDIAKCVDAFQSNEQFKIMQQLRVRLKSTEQTRDEFMATSAAQIRYIAVLKKKLKACEEK